MNEIELTKEHMKQYVSANEHLISVKKQAPNTTVLKYKNKVFYKNWWTPELCELRGTVVDDNFDIVQRPFTKIFNLHESKCPKIHRDEPVMGVEKVNGFMAAATIRDDKLFISTTGSISSDFSDLARKHIEKLNWKVMSPSSTYIFEICDPTDPHVVPEEAGAYLLGTRLKRWENAKQHNLSESILDMVAEQMGAFRPKYRRYDTFQALLDEVRQVRHEGFVVWNDEGKELKIKSPYYLAVKFLGRKTEKRINELLNDPQAARQILDEEYYIVIDYLAENKDKFIGMTEQERFAFLREFFDNEIINDI